MKRKALFFFILSLILTTIIPAIAVVRVRGYYRKDGTYVQPHYRSNPDGNPYNNWSTHPNINPYTGKQGTKHISPNPSFFGVSNIKTPMFGQGDPIVGNVKSTARSDVPVYPKPPDFSKSDTFAVARVIDGDTIAVETSGGQVSIRLIGVDTPETVHPSKPVEYYGKEASQFTANLLKGEKVYLVTDPSQGNTDKYGRTLAYAYRAPDGLFVNAEIIRQGYGHAYTQYPFKYVQEFRQLEGFARQAEKGLWATKRLSDLSAPTDSTTSTNNPLVRSPSEGSQVKDKSQESTIIVYVTRTGAKYHRAGCRYLSKSQIPMTLEEAKKIYTPCSVCRP